MLILTGSLLWLSVQGMKVGEGENRIDFIWQAWEDSNKTYLLLMAFIALISHILRAERWKMLLGSTGNHVKLSNSFFSLMIGYLVNLAVPRGGEVSRCYNLYKLESTPVEVSFGTVVVERIVDVLCLLLIIGMAFVVEWDKLLIFLSGLGIGADTVGRGFSVPTWAILMLVGLIGVVGVFYLFRKNERLIRILVGFKEGLSSVFKLKNKWLFVFYSLAIWFLYFLMSYFVVKAFDTTSHLGFSAVLSVFALGSIAMAVPVPGGAGSYHTIVPAGLHMLYAIPLSDATAFVFIFHGWQTLTMIVGGVVSLIISYFLIRWKKQPTK